MSHVLSHVINLHLAKACIVAVTDTDDYIWRVTHAVPRYQPSGSFLKVRFKALSSRARYFFIYTLLIRDDMQK